MTFSATANGFTTSAPEAIITVGEDVRGGDVGYVSFATGSNGERFLSLVPAEDDNAGMAPLRVIVNWLALLPAGNL